ncbi:MAG: HAMP domain-containing sensor histidine kinase [Bacteroidales bacterium]|nr:HAMP domain-containing sensor histidine kinase [Bacteroidales bacterium]
MNIYTQKMRWKALLVVLALMIIGASIFYTNLLVGKFANEERKNVSLWAAAVHRKAELVLYTESFFGQLQAQERRRVELLADVYKQVLSDKPSNDQDLTFFIEIIEKNTTIPIILADAQGKILDSRNLSPQQDTIKYLTGKLKEEFSVYKPLVVILPFKRHYLYYRDSHFFTELKNVLNDYITSFMSEVALNSSSVPVIITDSTRQKVIQFGNLNDIRMTDPAYVQEKLDEMDDENLPIRVSFGNQGTSYIYYQDSELLTIMKYFPLAQIVIIGIFALIAYLLFSYARRSEQNRVWAGMAKETAHQLGTPLSSIMAWIEILKLDDTNTAKAAVEIEKDVNRLEVIAERFSKIGSEAALKENDIVQILCDSIQYLKPRTTKKINYAVNVDREKQIFLPVNAALMSWVIENLCKNAIDAMNSSGTITIELKEEPKFVLIDISDTGKGISLTEQKMIFNPGYTTKKRGWGLGLSLAKRIVKQYHKGKLFVKTSAPGKGTTFRIVLKK